MCCVTPKFIHAKAAWEHALSHLIRWHYFLLALRPAAQLLSVYPPTGNRFCKHPRILCAFLCMCAHILHYVCQDKFHNPQDFMRVYLATTMCSYRGVCPISFKSVSHITSFLSHLRTQHYKPSSSRNKTGTDKKQKRTVSFPPICWSNIIFLIFTTFTIQLLLPVTQQNYIVTHLEWSRPKCFGYLNYPDMWVDVMVLYSAVAKKLNRPHCVCVVSSDQLYSLVYIILCCQLIYVKVSWWKRRLN